MLRLFTFLFCFVHSSSSFKAEQVSGSEFIYFSYYNSLFKTDGIDTWSINIRGAPSSCEDKNKCFIHSLTVLQNHLFFSYNNALMFYDGDYTIMVPLNHVAPTSCSEVCYLHSLLPVEDTMWFVYRNGIMKYNNTEGGVERIPITNIPQNCHGSRCYIHSLAFLNGDLYFSANGALMRFDGTHTFQINIMNPPQGCNGDYCYLREIVSKTVSQDPDPEEGCTTEHFFALTMAIGSGLVLICCCTGMYLLRRLANRKEPDDDDQPYGRLNTMMTDAQSRRSTRQFPQASTPTLQGTLSN